MSVIFLLCVPSYIHTKYISILCPSWLDVTILSHVTKGPRPITDLSRAPTVDQGSHDRSRRKNFTHDQSTHIS